MASASTVFIANPAPLTNVPMFLGSLFGVGASSFMYTIPSASAETSTASSKLKSRSLWSSA